MMKLNIVSGRKSSKYIFRAADVSEDFIILMFLLEDYIIVNFVSPEAIQATHSSTSKVPEAAT